MGMMVIWETISAALRLLWSQPADDTERERRARVILDEMFQFVALLDADGTLLEVNQTALDAAGVPRAEAIGLPLWEERVWPSKEARERLRTAIAKARGGDFVRYEVDVLMGAGGRALVTIDFSLKPIRDRAGRVVFLLAEGRDISAMKRAEAEVARKNEELRQLYDRLKELDRVKTQFFANVSHELRTPLALILGPTRRLLASDAIGEAARRDLETVERNARTLLTHVNDLLDIAKLEAGRMALGRVGVDLARLVHRVASLFELIAREHGVELTVATPESLLGAVDPDKLERVLVNLLSNAFKFVPEGGRVRVELRAAEDRIVLGVEDSGPGVPAELRQAIFDRFRRGEDSTTRRFGGTGLGLSIAKEFVELHGGRIVVEDAPAGGALFRVELPAAVPEGVLLRDKASPALAEVVRQTREALRPPPAPTPVAGEGDGRPLVLVVEDNPEMNRYLAETLAAEYRVATAFDGRDGVEQARALRPDLILTDVMMPAMGGAELVRAVRAERDLDATPVVVLTAKADEELRVGLLHDGAQDYIMKPFAAEELCVRVGNLVRLKRARDVLQQELASQGQDLAALATELSRRQRELAAASRAKDEFLSTLSHELRTPVTGVLAWLWMLRRGQLDASAVPRALETMEGSIRALVRIIDDLLDASRFIRGQLRLELQPTSLPPVVEAAAEAVHAAAAAKGIKLETVIDPEAGLVQGDAGRLQQVVWNLLVNGIKFTPGGGRVALRLDRAGADVRVTVSDTGIGIAPSFLPHVFERFRQADAGTTREHGGLGLGLAIVRHLVERHGGTVRVESAGRDQGATFTVTLPAIGTACPAATEAVPGDEGIPEATPPTSSLEGLRVLVVDDEAATREALEVLLGGAGAQVRGSASAAEALEALGSWKPSVVVADIAMPGEDGHALVRKVRALAPEHGGGTPALALTAYVRAEDRQRALAAGFQDYLAKPVDPPALVAAIAALAKAGPVASLEGAHPEPGGSSEPRREPKHAGAETVLFVEDDAGARAYARAVLQQFGYRVLTARSGEEGLRLWGAHRDEIDVVVTDLVMLPGSSGARVWQAVHAERADVPVVVVSGYPLVAEMLDARHQGVVECLEKPVEPEDLAAAVRRALGQAQTH